MSYQYVQLGTLYMGDRACDSRGESTSSTTKWDGKSSMAIKETVKGKAIRWVKPDGMNVLVADHNLLISVSWEALEKFGFTDGKTICIDGELYLCRLLQVGAEPDGLSEWDRIVDVTGDSNELWHWRGVFFWGSDTPKDAALRSSRANSGMRVTRGCVSAREWRRDVVDRRDINVGFRPALEILRPNNLKSDWRVNLDGEDFAIMQMPGVVGPVFYPHLISVTGLAFANIPDGTILKMYTLLCDDKPIIQTKRNPLTGKPAPRLTITDRFFGEEYLISWVISNGAAVATRPVLKGTSSFGLTIRH